MDAAAERLRRLLLEQPDDDALYCDLGELHRQAERVEEAIECFEQALSHNPTNPFAHNNYGEALRGQGQLEAAIAHYQAALETEPDFPAALNNLAEARRAQGEYAEALNLLRRAVAARPDVAAIRNNLANVLADRGDYPSAIEQYRQALRLEPNYADAHGNLADALAAVDCYGEALREYDLALKLNPRSPTVLNNLGNAFRELGRLEEALQSYDAALALWSGHAGTHYNRSLALLAGGNWQQGWREHLWRWKRPETPPRPCKLPEWDGTSLAGRTILIHAEQGVGDEVMLASCFPEVIARAGHCAIECDVRLVPLWERSFPAATVVAQCQQRSLDELARQVAADVQVPAGNLPLYLRADEASFPRKSRLLVPAAKQVEAWRRLLASLGEGLKIGISWQGGARARERRRRSIPLEQWRTLVESVGTHWINLQYGPAADEADRTAFWTRPIHRFGQIDPLAELDDFAALVAALDLVISVDNATVHIAGAIGTTSWVLLPLASDWRWLRDRNESVWYRSLRLFRQSTPGDWAEVLARIAGELSARVNQS